MESAAAPATVAVSSPHSAASPGGLRERAQALVWRLVNELSPPPGTRTVHLAKLPPPLNNPQPPVPAGWVRVQRTLEAPAQPASAWAGLLAHTPLRQIGTITPGATGSTILPAPEPGIDVAEFGVTLVQLSSKTILIAADADAAWLPARTPAEHLDPAAFGSVTISGDALCPGGHRVHSPVHAPGRWGTIRRRHPRRLPARLRHHRKRHAAAVAVGRRQAAHGGGRPDRSALIMPGRCRSSSRSSCTRLIPPPSPRLLPSTDPASSALPHTPATPVGLRRLTKT